MRNFKHVMLMATLAVLFLSGETLAQRRGGGGRGGGGRGGGMSRGGGFGGGGGFASRGGARASVTARPNYGGNINRSNIDRSDINRARVDIDRRVNVADVDINRTYVDRGYGCCYHPVARAAAVAGAAAVTAAAVNSTVYTLPASCSTVIVDGVTYSQCGSDWYRPEFYGTETGYVVVSPPR